MTNHLRRCTARLGAVLLLASLLCGCGDDRDAGPDAGASSGSSGSSESGEPAQPSASSDPAEPSETENGSGASGEAFDAGQFTVNGPEGWRMGAVTSRTVRFSSGQPKNNAQLYKRPHGLVFVDVTDVSGEPTLDALVEESVRSEPRLPDGTIDGEPAYHLANRDQAFETQEQLGLWRDGQQIRIDFSLIGGSKKQRQALVQSVLDSWQWS
ncbi:hypothetical protein [Nocardioides sp.]|uniref:hypothetical protein n=1 Tax=Nocardioides sp. TaxID=35761 RepID=UPI002ED2EF23